MDRPSHHPLTVDQAKERLRRTANNLGMAGYVKRNPYTALTLGFIGGIFLGSYPSTRDIIGRDLVRMLLRIL